MEKYEITPLFPDGKQKAFTMSYDDGNDCDVRLTQMMRRYGIRGTFNLNSGLMPDAPQENPPGKRWHRMSMAECLETFGDDMEIAIHGASHPWWNLLPAAAAMADILDDRMALEKATGKLVRGAAYPFGTWNEDVVSVLRQAGVQYCRTTKCTGGFRFPAKGQNGDFLLWDPTSRNRDPKMEELGEKFLTGDPREYLWVYYLWGHSYEFVADDSWERMEAFLQRMGGHDEVWYPTNIELIDYYHAYRALRSDASGGFLTNPTDLDVWVRHRSGQDVRTIRIPAGQSVSLPL